MAEQKTSSEPVEQASLEQSDNPDMASEMLRHAQDMTSEVFRHGPEAAGDVLAHAQDMTDDVLHHSRVAAGDVKRETPILIGHVWETFGDLFGTGKDDADKDESKS